MRRLLPGILLATACTAACTTAGDTGDDGVIGTPGPDVPGGDSAGVVEVGALRFDAQTRVLESFPVQLRTTLSIRNGGTDRLTGEMPGGCPVQLLAFRDPAREQLAWDQSRVQACTLQIRILELEPGASREFTASASAAGILGDSLPDGRYYLTAVTHLDRNRIEVPAGSADLAVDR